jgi:hypothetical protein
VSAQKSAEAVGVRIFPSMGLLHKRDWRY